MQVWILVAISAFAAIIFLEIVLRKKTFHQNETESRAEYNNRFGSVLPIVVLGNLVGQGTGNFPFK